MIVHWLTPGRFNAIQELSSSKMASVRMRAGLVAKHAKSMKIEFNAGDILSERTDIVVIGKIGADCENGRDNLWFEQIYKAYLANKIIILDYTDNHLDNPNSRMCNFYKKIIPFCTKSVVPSAGMVDLLMKFYGGKISVIEDPLEVQVMPPQISKPNNDFTLLWFGHGSNVSYLIEYLRNDLICDAEFNLVVLTNQYGINEMRALQESLSSKTKLILSEWSLQNMVSFSKICQGCIIPSGLKSSVKSGASSNRLITAFAMGLPVSADLLSSYSPFSQYFHNIQISPISEFRNDINYYYKCTEDAQKNIVPLFREEVISQKWSALINN